MSLLKSLTFFARSPMAGGICSGPSSRRASARPIGESITMPMIGIISATSSTSRTIHMSGVYAGSKALSRAAPYQASTVSYNCPTSDGP